MTLRTAFLDPSGRLRTAWRFVIFGIGLLVMQITVGVAAVIVGLAILLATGGARTVEGALLQMSGSQLLIFAIATLPATIANGVLVWLCRRFLDCRDVWSLGLRTPAGRGLASVWTGFALGSAPIALSVLVLVPLGQLQFIGPGGSLLTLVLVPMFLVAAFNEELICRGYLLQNLVEIGRPRWAIWFSSGDFGLEGSAVTFVAQTLVIAILYAQFRRMPAGSSDSLPVGTEPAAPLTIVDFVGAEAAAPSPAVEPAVQTSDGAETA